MTEDELLKREWRRLVKMGLLSSAEYVKLAGEPLPVDYPATSPTLSVAEGNATIMPHRVPTQEELDEALARNEHLIATGDQTKKLLDEREEKTKDRDAYLKQQMELAKLTGRV